MAAVSGDALSPDPLVSVLIPMLNEQDTIGACLEGFDNQSWPKDRLEVLVADSGSTDGSRQTVEKLATTRPWLSVVENPKGSAAAAFNIGLREARGEVLVLFSAHGTPDPDFLTRSVRALATHDVAGVGGRLEHRGDDPRSRAIGRAMASKLGMASPFRYSTDVKLIDTVGHPAYRRRKLDGIGEFSEMLGRNSDYEFNWRLRESGGTLLFDPSISSTYRVRSSLVQLAQQFWWYGRWKAEVIWMHPRSGRTRHLVAPAFSALVWGLPVTLAVRRLRRPMLGVVTCYALAVVGVTLREWASEEDPGSFSATTFALAFPTMHLAWGSGFLLSIVRRLGGLRVPVPRRSRPAR